MNFPLKPACLLIFNDAVGVTKQVDYWPIEENGCGVVVRGSRLGLSFIPCSLDEGSGALLFLCLALINLTGFL